MVDVRLLSGKKFDKNEYDKFNDIGCRAGEDFLISQGLEFISPADFQEERYCDYDFRAKNSKGEYVTFEVETRQGIDLANYQIVNSKGRFGLTGIHFSYRKHTSQADYFLSYVEPIEGEIEEAIGVFDRYVVLESVVRKTMVDVVENGCTVRKLNFFFNVDRDKGSIYVKRKGIWEPCYISILPKFESLYEKWLIEKGEEHRGRIERWNNYIEVNLGLKQRRNGYGERS